MTEDVKMIFKRALYHHKKVLEELRDDNEIDFSNEIFREDIQDNISKIENMIEALDSPDPIETLDRNRKLMCCSLKSYIAGLEKTRKIIETKLQDSDPSLPVVNFTKVKEELELAKRIQTRSCIDHGF